MLVVLAILGVVLAGLTQLFVSATHAQSDQTQRGQAQQAARLALDKLRREIHCASTISTPSGYPASSVTITLGSWCNDPAARRPSRGARRTRPAPRRRLPAPAVHALAVRRRELYRHGDEVGVEPRGQWDRRSREDLQCCVRFGPDAHVGHDGRHLAFGNLFVRGHGGARERRRSSGCHHAHRGGEYESHEQDHRQLVGLPGCGLVQRVRPRRQQRAPAQERRRRDVVRRYRADLAHATTLHAPANWKLTINVASTSSFNSTANTIQFGASGPVTCTGTTATSFTGCTGGQAGQYAKGTPVYSASSTRPPLSTLSVSLPVDLTPADAKQRYVLSDDIALRNSR